MKILSTFVTIAVVLSIAAPALADGVAGTVTIARPSGSALAIWDASADVASIVTNKTSDADANALLERDALHVLAGALAKFDKHSDTIRLRVIFQKTGAVSPVYGSATFTGVERYATLELKGDDAFGDRDTWKETPAEIPHWISFTVTGALPAR